MVWLNPVERQYNVEWDFLMCVSNSAGAEAKRLMLKAFKVFNDFTVLLS